MIEVSPSWWRAFFSKRFADLVLVRDHNDASTRLDLECLKHVLQLDRPRRVLDQCCGIGRHAVPLARAGHDVVAVDQSSEYIQRARNELEFMGLRASLHASDATTFRARPVCDAAFNWATSFGYSTPTLDTDAALVRAAYESLRAGGRYALELPNAAHVIEQFQPRMEQTARSSGQTVQIVRTSELTHNATHLLQTWTYLQNMDVLETRTACTRLYQPDELVALFQRCGFDAVRVLDPQTLHPLSTRHVRCLVVATRA